MEEERRQAVEKNLGVVEGGEFIYKNEPSVDVRYICIPNASIEQIEGTITHVIYLELYKTQSHPIPFERYVSGG